MDLLAAAGHSGTFWFGAVMNGGAVSTLILAHILLGISYCGLGTLACGHVSCPAVWFSCKLVFLLIRLSHLFDY